MYRKNRNLKRIKVQSNLVDKQKPHNRVEYEKIIDDRSKELEDILIAKNKDFRKYNLLVKADDITKDKRIIQNKSFKSLKDGFLSANNREKYIKENKDYIKALTMAEQRNLIKMFLQYL